MEPNGVLEERAGGLIAAGRPPATSDELDALGAGAGAREPGVAGFEAPRMDLFFDQFLAFARRLLGPGVRPRGPEVGRRCGWRSKRWRAGMRWQCGRERRSMLRDGA